MKLLNFDLIVMCLKRLCSNCYQILKNPMHGGDVEMGHFDVYQFKVYVFDMFLVSCYIN